MMKWIWRNKISILALVVMVLASNWVVKRFHKPGQLDVIAAQAMDMSQMRPPTGIAVVDLVPVRQGSLADTVTYTGSVMAFNEQDISPRVTGRLVSLPVYPGDTVRAGEVVAQLDTAELSAKTDQALAQVRQARISQQVAVLTHHLHHTAAMDVASAQMGAAEQGVTDAEEQAQAARDAIGDADAGVQSAEANADYWRVEIAREKQLADAGAASRQEYQNELAQSQGAQSAVTQAKSKASEARAMVRSALAKVAVARRQVTVAASGRRMAQADLTIAESAAREEGANAAAAQSAFQQAAVIEGYTRIVSPSAGVVTARLVAPGTLVQPGTVVLKVAEIDRVRVQANVAVDDLAGIAVGSPVKIVTGASAIAARVTALFPSANADTRTAVVEAVIPNPGHHLMPGAFVTMHITKATDTDKMLVPAESVLYEEGQPYLWVARGNKPVAVQYRATGCGMIYSASDAKKNHYICPMDHSKIVPVSAASDSKPHPNPLLGKEREPDSPSGLLTAHRIDVTAGASDGDWTEVASADLQQGDQIVRHGQAGLIEDAKVTAAAWGPDGPKKLPTAAQVPGGETQYRCEVCGLTFSASDAKKYGYHDPMEGGKLVPVR